MKYPGPGPIWAQGPLGLGPGLGPRTAAAPHGARRRRRTPPPAHAAGGAAAHGGGGGGRISGRVQAPIPSHPGIKYPVRAPPLTPIN